MALEFFKRKSQKEAPKLEKLIEPESIELLGETIDREYRKYLTLQLGEEIVDQKEVKQKSLYFNLNEEEIKERKRYAFSELSKEMAEGMLNERARNIRKVELLAKACNATKSLSKDYDLGIALATDGLYLGYIAQKFGFPF